MIGRSTAELHPAVPLRDYRLADTGDDAQMWAIERDRPPRDVIEFMQGAVMVSFTGPGRPLYETLFRAALAAGAPADELEYYA